MVCFERISGFVGLGVEKVYLVTVYLQVCFALLFLVHISQHIEY